MIGDDLRINGYGNTVELMILDFKSKYALCIRDVLSSGSLDATLLSVEPEIAAGRDLLLRYMGEYFDLLHNCGNHVLFSLPRFDFHGVTTTLLDYTLMGASHYWVGDINGVTVEQLNAYISSLWLKSALLANGRPSQTTDWCSRSLAEISTSSIGPELGSAYGKFRMKFGPPRVDIICSREVIVYFNIDELEFFATDDFCM